MSRRIPAFGGASRARAGPPMIADCDRSHRGVRALVPSDRCTSDPESHCGRQTERARATALSRPCRMPPIRRPHIERPSAISTPARKAHSAQIHFPAPPDAEPSTPSSCRRCPDNKYSGARRPSRWARRPESAPPSRHGSGLPALQAISRHAREPDGGCRDQTHRARSS